MRSRASPCDVRASGGEPHPRRTGAASTDGTDHPEGICWDPVQGYLGAGGEVGQVYRIDPGATVMLLTTITGGEQLDRLALASRCGTKFNSIALPYRGGAVNYPESERESA